MVIADRVIFYTHESSDAAHSTRDSLAIVLRVVDDNCADIVIFPAGGPTRYERACRWNDDAPLPPPGGNYIRGWEENPPDFATLYRWYGNSEFQDLIRKQQLELQATPVKDHQDLLKAHREEQGKLMDELDGDEPEPDEPEPAKPATPGDETDA